MSYLYVPDPGANLKGSLATADLSQRDISIRVPINFVPHQGVILQSACFSNDVYEYTAAQTCLSNLLATGFRRLVIDLYWNPLTSAWTLCPAALPPLDGQASSTASSASATSTTLATASISTSLTRRAAQASATATSAPTPSEVAGSPGLYQIGQYQCSTSVDVNLIVGILDGYLYVTGNNIDARIIFVVLNLHNATLVSSDSDTSQLPPPSIQPLSPFINSTLSTFIYTPPMLAAERANLNASWFGVSSLANKPDESYINYSLNASGYAYTTDGWPNEGYSELTEAKRLLVGYGSSDFPSSQYDPGLDGAIIFPPGQLTNARNVTFDSAGNITSGCFFDSSSIPKNVINNSYAVPAQAELGSSAAEDAATSMALCGITSMVNETLGGVTAGTNISAYASWVSASSWSWYPGQPSDQTANENEHCAAMNISDVANGRWQVMSCNARLYGACRMAGEPYKWTLTSQRGSYDSLETVCGSNASFNVPQTALENAYLRAAALDVLQDGSDPEDELVWLNFNDLDISGCWTTGVNAKCPYTTTKSVTSREVVVPTVVAVIVFVLALLTIFVKYATNRRGAERSKRRLKQRDGLGEYEGVPS